eukprot:TRINITY_DN51153_c0_g1_i1.p1 TRINITY_DN51153_c0_g1~~TRINITY_DN51153_c0_g1_i1.p1  ORF type:complete len:323 (+),score=55.69 TRINITY_DN51153_c0_g1_i1:80-1048(+)
MDFDKVPGEDAESSETERRQSFGAQREYGKYIAATLSLVFVAAVGTVLYIVMSPNTEVAGMCPDMADCSGVPGFTAATGSHHDHFGGVKRITDLSEMTMPYAAQVLSNSYNDVFKTGNRNSASHLWSSFIFNRSSSLSTSVLEDLFTGFCAVSGSVVVPISRESRWRLTLQDVNGVPHKGFMYYCTGCMGWPCLCDAKENIKLDTKTVNFGDGSKKQYKFAVIGNPCATPASSAKLYAEIDDPMFGRPLALQRVAPELYCDSNILQGATLSDHGHIILAMFFDDSESMEAHDEHDFDDACSKRSAAAGMGPLFRALAKANPL